MTIEYTFAMIKPDITLRNMIGRVLSYLENNALKVVGQKMLVLSTLQAEAFYAEHAFKPFFKSLVQFITSGEVVVMCIQGENAVQSTRNIIGDTDPAKAIIGTIRKDFGLSIDQNSIHASDSKTSAIREIGFFFSEIEICR